ncbi:MAG: hypothetical protein NC043_03240 [Muribaculaceae bacterium]|nr:hypothetical protein [Muribaculaceae bacterium]
MKHLLTSIFLGIILLGVMPLTLNMCPANISAQEKAFEVTDFGDSLTTVNGVTYALISDDDDDGIISSRNKLYIMAYDSDGSPIDSCCIYGVFNAISASDGVCSIVAGADTLNISLDSLPDSIDLRPYNVHPGAATSSVDRTFALSDSSYECRYLAEVSLLPNTCPGIMKYLNDYLLANISAYNFSEDSYSVTPYSGNLGDVTSMLNHYFNEYKHIYFNEYDYTPEAGEPKIGPQYNLFFSMLPTWESTDKSLVTYKFYIFDYYGGAHGGMNEFYATFNAHTGQRLRANDLIDAEGFDLCLKSLEQQLTAYRLKSQGIDVTDTDDYTVAPDLDIEYESITASSNDKLKENYGGHWYPIPAMTGKGLVFSYQPYENGSFADGIRHYTVSYDLLKKHLKI